MCGIAVVINSERCELDNNLILNNIKHRGDNLPQNVVLNDKNALGSVRLRILDRPNGTMPIYDEEKTLAIVFNGEIYNYKSLRDDLISKGYRFRTDTDTEVILHLYKEFGVDAFLKLDGMFAFVIYSLKEDSYIAVRDRWGIKPIYYSKFEDSIYFSSEVKGFNNLSFIEEIQELKPGMYVKNGQLFSYYEQSYKVESLKYHSAKNKVRQLLEEAVGKRVDTDLPIGVFLSGGVDSSIVFLLAKKFHSNVTPIVIGKDDSSDVQTAKKLCNEIGSKCIHINISEEVYLENIPEVIRVIESFEPNTVRGAALSYYLAKAAYDNELKVILCGEGSDEIFGGYGDFIGLSSEAFQLLTQKFIDDLYRTQLLRIDRTAMDFGVEVREPFMDNKLVDYAVRITPNYKVRKCHNVLLTKYILRDAFKDLLPDYIFSRVKKTLMEGAGAGNVEQGSGVFYKNAKYQISDDTFKDIQDTYINYQIDNEEEAFYFDCYRKYLGLRASFVSNRTFNALQEIK